MATKTSAFSLPYPVGINVKVFRDDGNWGVSPWFVRSNHVLRSLHVANITLAHYEGEGEPAYTAEEWARKSREIVEKYPNCVFIYA